MKTESSRRTWFRFHAETVHKGKIHRLTDKQFRAWVNLMCLGCEADGYLPGINDVAFALRVTEPEAAKRVSELREKHLVDETVDGTFRMHDWDAWQFQSDVSTKRVREFRKRKGNVSGTPPDTETETDTEQKHNSGDPILALKTATTSAGIPFDGKDPIEWFADSYPGEIPHDIWRVFPISVKTPEELEALAANGPLWFSTRKYREGFAPNGAKFLTSGVWRRPPPPALLGNTVQEESQITVVGGLRPK
jgi:hypothetical protein